MTDMEQLLAVAKMYYEQGLTQQEIAEKVFLSRSHVSRMLKEARALGIVEIIIRSPFENHVSLEMSLAERFGMEIGIAEKLAEIKPDEKLYLIKCAWGSASLFNDFASPSMKNYPTSVYYDKFISVVKAGISKLEELTDLPVEIKALCWMQGEKDAAYYSEASQYGPNLQTFAGDFRSEFSAYKGRGEIAFIDAEISEGEYCAYSQSEMISMKRLIYSASTERLSNSSRILSLVRLATGMFSLSLM